MRFKVGDKVKILPLKEVTKIFGKEYYNDENFDEVDTPYGIPNCWINKFKNKTLTVNRVLGSFNRNHGTDIKIDEDSRGNQWPSVWFVLVDKQLEFAFEGEENA
jgi:hypothetical protein